ncbi:putative MICOS complex subunit Mic10 protein [Helianthus anomalus]
MSKNKEIPPPQYDLNAKWDACLDLGVRRFFYSSATGAFAGLLFFHALFNDTRIACSTLSGLHTHLYDLSMPCMLKT